MRPFSADGAFEPYVSGGDRIRQLAVRGAGITLFSSVIALAVQVASTVVLARLLMPGRDPMGCLMTALLGAVRREAKQRGLGYQSLINELLAKHVARRRSA